MITKTKTIRMLVHGEYMRYAKVRDGVFTRKVYRTEYTLIDDALYLDLEIVPELAKNNVETIKFKREDEGIMITYTINCLDIYEHPIVESIFKRDAYRIPASCFKINRRRIRTLQEIAESKKNRAKKAYEKECKLYPLIK